MTTDFDSLEEAFAALVDPSSPKWGDAFRFLADQPETAQLILETFSETLAQMGVQPTGADPVTGAPTYSLSDVARAMGLPEADLDTAIRESGE